MDFFALDSWVNKIFPNKNLNTLEKLDILKPIFEQLYHIEINIPEIEAINIIENKYISLKYKRSTEDKTCNITVADLYDHYNEDLSNIDLSISDRSNFMQKLHLMERQTILWRLMGLESPKKPSKIDPYSLPKFQLQLIINLIGKINSISFYSSENNPLKTTFKKTDSINMSSHFDDSLLHNLDHSSSNEADIIVSYYILERLFGFNLCYKMTNVLEESNNYDDINNTD